MKVINSIKDVESNYAIKQGVSTWYSKEFDGRLLFVMRNGQTTYTTLFVDGEAIDTVMQEDYRDTMQHLKQWQFEEVDYDVVINKHVLIMHL